MCMSRLHQVVEANTGKSEVTVRDLEGREQKVSLLAYEGPDLHMGDWLVAQSGFALAPVAPEEARAALSELEALEPEVLQPARRVEDAK